MIRFEPDGMRRFHIVGRKNHGKTRLIVELVQELAGQGFRVGTIKHTHHRHELDVPGKDSHRHRNAGAVVSGVLSRSCSAIFLPEEPDIVELCDDRYERLAPMFRTCDIVLVEGDLQTEAPKIEVWRAEIGTSPLAAEDDAIMAVVTDDRVPACKRVFARSNVPRLAKWIVGLAAMACCARNPGVGRV